MPSVLQNIGASRAGTSLAEYAAQQRRLRVAEGRLGVDQDVGEARIDNLETSTNMNREQLLQTRKKFAEDNKPIPFDVLKNKSKSPEAGQYAESLARELGFINEDGSIKAKHAKELQGFLATPMHVQNLSDMSLIRTKKEYDALVAMSKDPDGELAKKSKVKVDSPEFKEQLKQAETAYTIAQGRSTGFTNAMKSQLATQKLQLENANKLVTQAQNQAKITETGRHNKQMERLKSKADKSNYKLTDLKLNKRSKYFADPEKMTDQEKQLIGVDVDPFLRTGVSIVMSDLSNISLSDTEKLTKVLEMSRVLKLASSGKAPEKKQIITEDIYKFYEKQGKTRKQVDEAYRLKYGAK
jgi:hypothetical protein